MLEAVARNKARWLFDKSKREKFIGKRPQEDMVTSAVLGTIRLLPQEEQAVAISYLLGEACTKAAGIDGTAEIEIDLWPSLRGVENRTRIEPDVVILSEEKAVIVEVKWHAELSKQQVQYQLEAVQQNYENHEVIAALVLGQSGSPDTICSTPRFWRTWRNLSEDLQKPRRVHPQTSLTQWMKMVHDFLQATDIGRVYGGIAEPSTPCEVAYSFAKPGKSPWFRDIPNEPKVVQYKFGERND